MKGCENYVNYLCLSYQKIHFNQPNAFIWDGSICRSLLQSKGVDWGGSASSKEYFDFDFKMLNIAVEGGHRTEVWSGRDTK